MLKNAETYEIMTPDSVGLNKSSMVLGKHSGKHAFKTKIVELGYNISEAEMEIAFIKFKAVADKKKTMFDKDIEAILDKESVQVPKAYTTERFVITCGNTITSTATIMLVKDEKKIEKVARGDGPIDAAFKAIEKIVGKELQLHDYQIESVTEGQDALGDALVKIKAPDGVIYSGRGLSTDIIEASIYAYVNAVNKMIYMETQNSNM
jgi:2-isopropylmalate synthase